MWSVVRLEFKSEEGEVTRYFHNLFFEEEVLESATVIIILVQISCIFLQGYENINTQILIFILLKISIYYYLSHY